MRREALHGWDPCIQIFSSLFQYFARITCDRWFTTCFLERLTLLTSVRATTLKFTHEHLIQMQDKIQQQLPCALETRSALAEVCSHVTFERVVVRNSVDQPRLHCDRPACTCGHCRVLLGNRCRLSVTRGKTVHRLLYPQYTT